MEKITEINVSKRNGKIVVTRYNEAYLPGIATSRADKKEFTEYEDVIKEFSNIKKEFTNNEKRNPFHEEFTKEIRLNAKGISIVFESEELAEEFLKSDRNINENKHINKNL